MNETKVKRLLVRISDLQNEQLEILKTKAAYGYNYAPLEMIIPVLVPKFKEHGIGYVHTTGFDADSKQNYLETTFFSLDDVDDKLVSRTNIDSTVKLAKMNDFMVLGSGMTYFRRYHLVVMAGLITDEDTDAGGAIPSTDKQKTAPTGRSVEANATQNEDLNFVAIFQNLISKNTAQLKVEKTFDNYKKLMNTEQLKAVSDLISNTYK